MEHHPIQHRLFLPTRSKCDRWNTIPSNTVSFYLPGVSVIDGTPSLPTPFSFLPTRSKCDRWNTVPFNTFFNYGETESHLPVSTHITQLIPQTRFFQHILKFLRRKKNLGFTFDLAYKLCKIINIINIINTVFTHYTVTQAKVAKSVQMMEFKQIFYNTGWVKKKLQ